MEAIGLHGNSLENQWKAPRNKGNSRNLRQSVIFNKDKSRIIAAVPLHLMAETLLEPLSRRNLIVKSGQKDLYYSFRVILSANASNYLNRGRFSKKAVEWEVLSVHCCSRMSC